MNNKCLGSDFIMDKAFLLAPLVLLIPAIIVISIGIYTKKQMKKLKQTEGVYVRPKKEFGLGYPRPIVKYEVDGKEYVVQSKRSTRSWIPYGKKVTIYYDPAKPEKMIINAASQNGTVHLVIGYGFIVLMLIILFIFNFLVFIPFQMRPS